MDQSIMSYWARMNLSDWTQGPVENIQDYSENEIL